MKQALNQPCQPEQDGFEFSNGELTLWLRRRKLEEQADELYYYGRLPVDEAEQTV